MFGLTVKEFWVFATNSNFIIPIPVQPYGVNSWYFKLRLFDLTEFILWNIQGLRHWVAKIKELKTHSLLQRLNSFSGTQKSLRNLSFIYEPNIFRMLKQKGEMNFLHKYCDDTLNLQTLTANQFFGIWEHYDTDGKFV